MTFPESLAESQQIKEEIRARYNRMADAELASPGAFESLSRARNYFRTRKLDAALDLGEFPSGGRILEVGCSVGHFTFPLARRGYRVHGVDLSTQSVQVAVRRVEAERVPDVTFAVEEAEELCGVPSETCDGVVSFSTLRYVPDLPKALAAIHRVLKPGASAVVDFPNRRCPWFYLKPWLGSERHPHDRWFTTSEVRRMVEAAGFQDVRVRHILFTPTVAPAALLPLFQGADWIGERLPLIRRLAGIIMVSARKP